MDNEQKLAWNGNFRPFASGIGEHTSTLLYDYYYDPFPGVEVKWRPGAEVGLERPPTVVPSSDKRDTNKNYNMERKRRLTSDQIELLETSFQEEIKLEPERKMKLAKDLGLPPRQVAVWFQNRRARWKVKQLESVYDALKQEFDVISREKQKLQEEVVKLKAILEDRTMAAKQGSADDYTEASAEKTIGSTSVVIRNSNKKFPGPTTNRPQIADCNQLFNVDDYNPDLTPYWAATAFPGYH